MAKYHTEVSHLTFAETMAAIEGDPGGFDQGAMHNRIHFKDPFTPEEAEQVKAALANADLTKIDMASFGNRGEPQVYFLAHTDAGYDTGLYSRFLTWWENLKMRYPILQKIPG